MGQYLEGMLNPYYGVRKAFPKGMKSILRSGK